MATKRADQSAVQIRLSDEEARRLDKWVDAAQRGRPGGSGVSRTTLLRDLLITELDKREFAIAQAKAAETALVPMGPFVEDPFKAETSASEIKSLLLLARPTLQAIAGLPFRSAHRAAMALKHAEEAERIQTKRPIFMIELIIFSQALDDFVKEIDLYYGPGWRD